MATALNYKSPWGMTYEVWFYGEISDNGLNLGLLCKNDEYDFYEPYMDVTITVPHTRYCESDTAFVKDYSENEGLGNWLIENGIATKTGEAVRSGYVTIEEYKFDLEKVREHMLEN